MSFSLVDRTEFCPLVVDMTVWYLLACFLGHAQMFWGSTQNYDYNFAKQIASYTSCHEDTKKQQQQKSSN